MGVTVTDPLRQPTPTTAPSWTAPRTRTTTAKIDAGETDPTAGHGADDVGAANVGPERRRHDDDGVRDGAEPSRLPTPTATAWSTRSTRTATTTASRRHRAGRDHHPAPHDVARGLFVPDADTSPPPTNRSTPTPTGHVIDGAEDTQRQRPHRRRRDATRTPADDVPAGDTDGDGLADVVEELAIGHRPERRRQRRRRRARRRRAELERDTDGDGLINALDPDSDNDGLLDGTELGVTTTRPPPTSARATSCPTRTRRTTTNPLSPTPTAAAWTTAPRTPTQRPVDPGELNPLDPADDVPPVDTRRRRADRRRGGRARHRPGATPTATTTACSTAPSPTRSRHRR
jgi:clumping factor A